MNYLPHIMGKPAAEAKIIDQTIQSQALGIFISDIHHNIRLILKAMQITTFEGAVFQAVEEEKLFEKFEYRNDNKTKFNRKNNDKSKIKFSVIVVANLGIL